MFREPVTGKVPVIFIVILLFNPLVGELSEAVKVDGKPETLIEPPVIRWFPPIVAVKVVVGKVEPGEPDEL